MIVCIVGPTGVGKTKLSIYLAKKYNAIIVNADACQIYKELNIGTAKIKENEKCGIEHYLFDIKYPNEDYSVSHYQFDLRDILNKFKDRNIIIVGGTGLYIKAALYDYNFTNLKDMDLDKYSNEELYKMAKKIDENCEIHINNRRRLENFIKRQNLSNNGSKLLYDVIFIGLTTDRDILYDRINERVDKMFQEGLIDEVKKLVNKYGYTRILSSAIGYKEVISYLKGELDLDKTKELIKKNSRHYAKRQYTWFNNKMDINWFNVDFENFDNTCQKIAEFIKKTIRK